MNPQPSNKKKSSDDPFRATDSLNDRIISPELKPERKNYNILDYEEVEEDEREYQDGGTTPISPKALLKKYA